MDKLEAVRLAARQLDQAGDEELLARTPQDKAQARARLIEADRQYAKALDALHEARPSRDDDDTQTQASLERTG